jgi:hypothetical protein
MAIFLTPDEAKIVYAGGLIDVEKLEQFAEEAIALRAGIADAYEAGKAAALAHRSNENPFEHGSSFWVSYNRGFNLTSVAMNSASR